MKHLKKVKYLFKKLLLFNNSQNVKMNHKKVEMLPKPPLYYVYYFSCITSIVARDDYQLMCFFHWREQSFE